mmetsp:Transcript_7838/g.16324  ORF Transcript_7838/g.16324 Transcript_7838/m.16324 type:complete len:234 (+) Transcript_7838:654-1355(+)
MMLGRVLFLTVLIEDPERPHVIFILLIKGHHIDAILTEGHHFVLIPPNFGRFALFKGLHLALDFARFGAHLEFDRLFGFLGVLLCHQVALAIAPKALLPSHQFAVAAGPGQAAHNFALRRVDGSQITFIVALRFARYFLDDGFKMVRTARIVGTTVIGGIVSIGQVVGRAFEFGHELQGILTFELTASGLGAAIFAPIAAFAVFAAVRGGLLHRKARRGGRIGRGRRGRIGSS